MRWSLRARLLVIVLAAGLPGLLLLSLDGAAAGADLDFAVRFVVALGVLLVVGTVGVDRVFYRPARRLWTAAGRLLSGDLSYRVDTRGMPQELAEAGEALNEMAPRMAITQNGLERLVEARTRDLERSNRDLQDFAYAASHDLRQPVRSITGYLDLAARYADDSDERAEYLERARRASLRMQDLIDALLAYSRITTGHEQARTVELGEVADHVRDDLASLLEEVGGSVTIESPLPSCHATPGQARLVLQNLVSNAVKFVPAGTQPRVVVRGRREGRTAVLEVQDNGIGIDEKYKDKVFGMFQRLHPRDEYKGHGIGLAIVKRVVEHHGGSVDYHCPPEGGTVFTVRLPTDAP